MKGCRQPLTPGPKLEGSNNLNKAAQEKLGQMTRKHSQGKCLLILAFKCSQSYRTEQVNNMPAVQETWVLSLGWEDLLEEGIATHSRILAWRIPWTEKPCRLQFTGSQRVKQTEMNQHWHNYSWLRAQPIYSSQSLSTVIFFLKFLFWHDFRFTEKLEERILIYIIPRFLWC